MLAFRWHRVAALSVCVLGVAVLTASGSAVARTRRDHAAGTTPACVPHVPTALPGDPNHVAAKLTGAARAGIGGYPGTVYRSPWANFKPKAKPPWIIGMSNNEGNLNAADVLKGLKEEAALNPGLVKKIIVTTPSTPNDVATQIQQMRSLIEQHVNFIISTLGSPTALNAVINQAAAKGIPTISLLGQSTSKNAVNLQPNPIQLGYYGARGLLTAMGTGKGAVLNVQGIPGLSINTDIEKGAAAVFKACKTPIAGNLTGDFSPSVAKTQVLTFLSAHPGTINGVFQVADMAPGIFSAFQQVGRKVPPVADIGAPAASLVYWKQHAHAGYVGTGVAIPAIKDGTYSMAVALAMLEGDGVKITDVPFAPPVITPANLNKWIQPGWTQSTNALGDGPPSAVPITALLDTYFKKAPKIKSAG